MKIQPFLMPDEEGNTHEVVVRWKAQGEEPFNKPIFEGALKECEEYIKTCQTNKEGDEQ